jgi:LmbE family N-acetylglucosaminyl deacetylase
VKKTILIVAPHPDDETLACGGTIAKRVKEGSSVNVIFLTDGRNSHLHELGIALDPTPDELIEIRKDEAKRATGILGLKNDDLIFLNLENITLKENFEFARSHLTQTIKRLRPEEIFFPDEEDMHKTHSAASKIVIDSIKTLSISPKKYQYNIWADKNDSRDHDNLSHLDVSSVLALKKQAICEYKSQVTNFSKAQERPILSEIFLERFRANTESFRIS